MALLRLPFWLGAKLAGSSGRYLPLIKFRAIDIESLQSMIFLHNTEDVSVVPGGDLVAVNVLLHLRLCILIFNKGFSQNKTVLWSCGSGSAWIRNFCLDPELLFRIRIQLNKKEKKTKMLFFFEFWTLCTVGL